MPSKKILEAKQAAVAALAEKLKNAASGVLVKYEGITVEDDTAMRKALREAGVEYSVIKNSITGRACEEAGFGAMKDQLYGMTALAISNDDPIAPAKILKEYVEKVDSFEFRAGFIDGAVIDKDAVIELADTPSKEVMIGRVLGSLQSGLYGLCYALQAIVDKSGDAADEAPAEAAAPAPEAAAEAPAAPAEA
ncbi:MAG: 50S ribosomal protein L10 [Clostridia bacterium]|nr:50S ribosomal protein L10 [Clostridia bacterium]